MANHLQITNVISGERESHSGKVKINQLAVVLDFYNSLYEIHGLKQHQPLRYIEDNSKIEQAIKKYDLNSVRLDCVFGGNYFSSPGNDAVVDESQICKYIAEYLSPLVANFNKQVSVHCQVIN